jgi:hypothetical protein
MQAHACRTRRHTVPADKHTAANDCSNTAGCHNTKSRDWSTHTLVAAAASRSNAHHTQPPALPRCCAAAAAA